METNQETRMKAEFGWNPAHPIGTCAKCGSEMVYNVPRLGRDGGYVHKENGGLVCPQTTLPPTND